MNHSNRVRSASFFCSNATKNADAAYFNTEELNDDKH